MKIDTTELDNRITGRVEPHIYAFSTNSIPNCLKVGDTYRPVSVRLNEWKEHYPDLKKEFEESARINTDVYFRDFSVHDYLEREKNKKRLEKNELPSDVSYYSKEFFKDTSPADVKDAIDDIIAGHKNKSLKYQYYSALTQLPTKEKFSSTGMWEPRPNQLETIDAFKKAVANGRTHLLMYAVMRFGKSFTSMCCAKAIAKEDEAQLVVVVSAKADVKDEWRRTVESADNFRNDYEFYSADDLKKNYSVITERLKALKKAVVFLTLQDLRGKDIKEKHEQIFDRSIDLLIVDETHFGARAEQYGAVLRTIKGSKETLSSEEKLTLDALTKQIKVLNANITLHLSGTPYRILMGSEFDREQDLIAFYQFTDIVRAQEEWDKDNLTKDEPSKEWDNPYYGFPQMIRFAFNPNESARRRMEELRKNGTSYAFSALFEPISKVKEADGSHKKFIHEQEILELFEVIDGSKEDDELLGFLDYDKIKKGNMCRHIVCVLPYCASCDALEEMLKRNAKSFKNLNEYEIINISGVGDTNKYKTPGEIKNAIKEFESKQKKTITLTVNRMLTGSTVPEWDTMLFLKDTASPQEYDQAVFRLQNQFIKVFVNDSSGDSIRLNMKPQTILVDFAPERVFFMQEQKAQIYNANNESSGNTKLKDRINEELRISPIIVMNKDKLVAVEAGDVLKAVSEYSRTRGVAEETVEIPVDLSLMEISEIYNAIKQENELGSRAGLTLKASEGEEAEMELPNDNGASDNDEGSENSDGQTSGSTSERSKEKKLDPVKQFRAYYARILFFAFLTKNEVISLEQIIEHIDEEDNKRIARNLSIKKSVLECISENADSFVLSKLDYKIQNLNQLSHDASLDTIARAGVAVQKFGKLGESEVITPKNICRDMLGMISDEDLKKVIDSGEKVLDIAGKSGEFALAVWEKYSSMGYGMDKLKDFICTIPTSGLAYEFTRMVYETLGLNSDNIACGFTSFDLLNVKTLKGNRIDYKKIGNLVRQNKKFALITMKDDVGKGGDATVKFGVVVGNPPFQEGDGGARASARPIYKDFVNISKKLEPSFMTLIIPTRWYAGGKGLNDFRKKMFEDTRILELHDFFHPEEVFPDTNNRGGVCYILWGHKSDDTDLNVRVVSHQGNGVVTTSERRLKYNDSNVFIRYRQAFSILEKIFTGKKVDTLNNYVSAAKAFGFRTYFVDDPKFRATDNGLSKPVLCYGKANKRGFVEDEEIRSHRDWIGRWKVYVPESNNIGTELNDDNQNALVGAPNTICTETFLVVGAELKLNKTKANNLSDYLKTRFARFLHCLAKISQHGTEKTYQFVPVQDFSEAWTDAKLYKKYGLTEEEIAFIESIIKPM